MVRGKSRTPPPAQSGGERRCLAEVEPVDVVFDGPPAPAPDGPQLVEVEDARGRSVVAGTWIRRSDGTWALRLLAHLGQDNTDHDAERDADQDGDPDGEQSERAGERAVASGWAGAGIPSFAPMLATTGGRELPPAGEFAFEFKFDGVRTIVRVGAGRVQLVSRAGNDVTAAYPELAVLGELLAEHTVVLDGEIVALDLGVPSFRRLQRRMHVHRPTPALQRAVPVAFYAFDVLFLDGTSLLDQPHAHRRRVLEELAEQAGLNAGLLVRVPPAHTDIDGQVLLDIARDQGLEGVIAKRVTSVYRPGTRSRDWLKFPLIRTTEAVVCGWRPGTGRRAGGIGSLILGAYTQPTARGVRQHDVNQDEADPDGQDEVDQHHTTRSGARGELVYIGHVGTGFTAQALTALQRQLAPLEQPDSPFDVPVPREHARGARWVRPVLVGEVSYKDFGGGRLRLPVWRGLRPDRAPRDVRVPGAT